MYTALWPLQRRGAQIPCPYISGHEDLARNIQLTWLIDKQAALPLEQARDHYLEHRVKDQEKYFQQKYRTFGDVGGQLRLIALSTTWIALACGVLALGVSLSGQHGWSFRLPKLAAMVLPLIPPALLSIVVALDMSRRSDRFRDVTANLQEVERRLRRVQTWPGLWREAFRCELMLLQEHAEWHALARYGAEH
jgi:hypothetical protein